MITIQKYVRPESLEEAYTLNQGRKNRIIAGMLWTKLSRESINTAIDLCGLGLDKIEETEESFSIGAMVTLRQLETHSGIDAYTGGAVAEALGSIVGVQFRNGATVGGSIWGRFGFSDVLTVFLGLDCCVELYKGGIVPLAEFSCMKPDGDILVRLIVKKTPGRIAYKSMRNQRTDFPVVTCAVSSVGGSWHVAVGARPGRAVIIPDEEGILADSITKESARAFARYVAQRAAVGTNMRASGEYRRHLIGVLTERALAELGGLDDGN